MEGEEPVELVGQISMVVLFQNFKILGLGKNGLLRSSFLVLGFDA